MTETIDKPLKIYVLGSNSFMKEMVAAAEQLQAMGYDGWIHQDYIDMVYGRKAYSGDITGSEHAAVKRENDYLNVHYKHILESDAILIVNGTKGEIHNYIGGNALIEMGQAFVNKKIIFLMNDIPDQLPYAAEIECMDPICLDGDLENIALSL